MKPLLEVKEIVKSYHDSKVIQGVSFEIYPGETFALVGESGSGKSTLGKILMNLIHPTSGQVFYEGIDVREIGRNLCTKMQMIFQDPFSSLNPRMTVEEIVGEPYRIHKKRNRSVLSLLKEVGLEESHLYRFPHEFSGGQRQRISIARALAMEPRLLIGDEPVSALDLVTQEQIISLLTGLKEQLGLTFLFISHDLMLVKKIADRIAVMYKGQLVELASTRDLFAYPKHPYTQALLSAIPIPDPIQERKRSKLRIQPDKDIME